jgi:hypothetical protein
LTYISSYGVSFRNVLAALSKCFLSKYTLAKGIILSVVSHWLRRRVPESWLTAGDSSLPDPVHKQLKALKTADNRLLNEKIPAKFHLLSKAKEVK